MSGYIDSDELCKSLKEMRDRADEWLANAKDDEIKHRAESTLMTLIEVKLRIDKQPTADVVPVVRCKDCFHSRPDEDGLECMMHYRPTKEDDFCSYGENDEMG